MSIITNIHNIISPSCFTHANKIITTKTNIGELKMVICSINFFNLLTTFIVNHICSHECAKRIQNINSLLTQFLTVYVYVAISNSKGLRFPL